MGRGGGLGGRILAVLSEGSGFEYYPIATGPLRSDLGEVVHHLIAPRL